MPEKVPKAIKRVSKQDLLGTECDGVSASDPS